ncbi:hypothetical protein NARC_60153 [Candidatus Nitrosocosmicus arcticus]|uniref:DUF6602 domain-containing protein n=2 Tax=Candidatus Nitrosocosmicus arcticus TaxID=2035267 RepID=A0A557SVY6_9ARCH|nr:hypothetical protein NARC_60153 [Candidatus Nitrosocosmicus arcticus]
MDIIIYDSFHQPEILSHSSQFLFPVDIVYCVIEVKTILNAKFFKEAIDNIVSVKKLNFIRYEKEEEVNYNSKPISPLGIIFAYKSTTNDYRTFLRWANDVFKSSQINRDHIFEKCYILKNTFSIKLPDIDSRHRLSFDFCHLNKNSSNKEKLRKNISIKDSNGKECKCDRSRGFLIFLSDLLRSLSLKETYYGQLLQKYFPKDFELQTGDEVNI